MQAILSCITQEHDQRLLTLAALVCTVGVYGTSAIAAHAARAEGRARLWWGVTSITAAGCTAWATHMIGLLAFSPGMASGFDPLLTATSLLAGIVGIGAGVGLSVGRRGVGRRFAAGVVLGLGVTILHYLGQAAYLITGHVTWDLPLVFGSIFASLLIFGTAMAAFGKRRHWVAKTGAPLLLTAIAVLHFCGMTAATFVFDPRQALPPSAISPEIVAPIVAGISIGLFILAFFGLRFTLAARAAARRDRERLRELASLAVEGLAICDGDVISTANQSLEALAGAPAGTLTGRTISALVPGLVLTELPEREERDAELLANDGQLVPVRVLRRQVVLGGKSQDIVAFRDQRERLRTETKIRTLAFTDPLTGLPNRARFSDLFLARAAACRERGSGFAVLLIDLHRFKLVNDTLGQVAGDTLLRELAGRLTAICTARDLVARLGGDEFAVLQVAVSSPREAFKLAQDILDALARPFAIEDHVIEIGASVGVAVAPGDGDSVDVLLRNADLALNKAKADGKGVFRAFEPELDRQTRARRELEADLRRALSAGEFEVATLNRLREAGINLALDDFGTGYSSLSYLRRFPFSKVKVDRSFVSTLPADAESAAIVRAIVTLASTLGMSTTVEGVETAEQFAFAAAEGCDQIQGYHVSRPVPAQSFRELLTPVKAPA